jgi:hypothetical protein
MPCHDPSLRRELLGLSLSGLDAHVAWTNVVLVLDGAPWIRGDVEAAISAVPGRGPSPRLLELPENRGKGGAMVAGLELLLSEGLEWLAVLDCDGDHAPSDLGHLSDLARMVADYRGNPVVEVVGRRIARHGALGYVRAELEGVTSRVVFSALRYALAKDQGRALDETWLAPYGEPDVEAGYRVYSRRAAEIVASRLPATAAEPGDERMMWWGIEVVPTVEIVLAGGVHAEGNRTTLEHQPTSSYLRGHDETEVYAAELSWILRRCQIPLEAAALYLEDAMLRTGLRTSTEGAAILRDITCRALSALPGGAELVADAPPRPVRRL